MSRRSWAVVCLCLGLSLAGAGCGGSSVNGSIVDGAGDGTVNPGSDNVTTPEGSDTITPPPSVPTAEVCNDGIDNDGNGVSDCADLACSSDPVCVPAPVAEICHDGIDNDGNGVTDCTDLACSSDPTCSLPPPVMAEVCDDGIDDDGDGTVDCSDTDCAGDSACGGIHLGKFDPGVYKVGPVKDFGPGPVCYGCPDPTLNWKETVIDPATKAEMVKQYGYRYNAGAFKFTDGKDAPEAVKAEAAGQGF